MTLRVQTAIKLPQQRAVFIDPVGVKDIGNKYGIESPWQRMP